MKKIVIALVLLFFLFGCATTESVQTNIPTKKYPNKQLVLREPVKETREISHFITFKAPPEGVEVVLVDTFSGKEAPLGTTPIRIFVLTKKLFFIDGRVDAFSDLKPIGYALQYGNGAGVTGGVEFQFKFRKFGFSDQMLVERIPFLMGDSDKVIEIKMVKIPQ